MFDFLHKHPPSHDRLFAELVEKYQEPLYGFISRRVGSHDDASDILQEVYIRAWRNLGKLRDPAAAKPWLMRIALNETNRFLTDSYRRNRSADDTIPDTQAEQEFVDYDRHMQSTFSDALQTLSERQRQVFSLHYDDELSYDDIAQIMDSTPANMKTTYHIAKQKIQQYISEHTE